jgi:hypothetical protein
MSNFSGRLSQPKKNKLFLGFLFFCQHNSTGGGFLILKQIILTFIELDISMYICTYILRYVFIKKLF